jgi:CHAT domain-containing protein/tetratricopeptide (TPR) repeat protein
LTLNACAFSTAQTKPDNADAQLDAATEQLVAALAAATAAADRRALLASAARAAVSDALRAALVARGRAARGAKRFAPAVAYFEAARSVAEFLRDRRGEVEALVELGDAYGMQGERAHAVESYQRACEMDAAAVNPRRLGELLFAIGALYFDRGEYTQAAAFYQRSLEAYEQNGGSKSDLAGVVYGLGAIHYLKGEYAEATELHRRTLKLAEESREPGASALALFGLAADFRMQGDYVAALRYYERSLDFYEQFTAEQIRQLGVYAHEQSISTVLRHIGTTYLLQGNYPLALRYFERVLRRDEAAQDAQGIAYSLAYMGGVYRAQGRYEQALDCLARSLNLFVQLGQRDGEARTLATMASVHHLRGDSARALEHFQRSLALREQMDAKEGIASSLVGLAAVYAARGEHAQTLAAAARAVEVARRIGSPHVLWGALLFAGRAHLALGQTTEARRAFDEAIKTIESLRTHVAGDEEGQELFFADKLAPYYEVAELLVRERKAAEAFAYVEAGKGRVLLDALRAGRTSAQARLTPAEAARERALKQTMNSLSVELQRAQTASSPAQARAAEQQNRLNDLQSRLEKARLEYSAFQATLDASHPELRIERGEARPLTRADVAALLPDEHTAIVEYVVSEHRTHLFVLTKEAAGARARPAASPATQAAPTDANEADGLTLKIYTVEIERAELARRAEQFRQQLAHGDLLFSRNARELYDLLLKPAESQLQDRRYLVVVPDDKLWELPFQALQPRAGNFLIEQCAITYAPSLTVLREMTRRRETHARRSRPPATLLALGNPRLDAPPAEQSRGVLMRGNASAPLPEAERQVRALAALYGPRRSRVYTGAAAREERFKREAGSFSILHLATHGTLDDASPMYSNVVLARAPTARRPKDEATGDDGLLEAWELMALRLDAELVVLSACETARGRVTPGEGLIGLSWAMFVAGSPTTVVSQWQVESASTTELMVEFHRHLQARFSSSYQPGPAHLTKAEALRRAALRLRHSERYAHPFYWAGFVLVGDGR